MRGNGQWWAVAAGWALIGWTVGGASVRADEPIRNLAELEKRYDAETEVYQARMASAPEAERAAIMAANWVRIRAEARWAFDYAKGQPDAADALDAILYTVHGMVNGYYPEYAAEINEAFRLLRERGLDDDRVAPVASFADGVADQSPEARAFLEAVWQRSRSRLVRGAAGLGLARTERGMGLRARRVRDPIVGPETTAIWAERNPGLIELARTTDPDAAERRAVAYYEQVSIEFADVHLPAPYRETPFAEIARRELFALQHLAPGRPAPEIIGEDVRGGPVRLSDHRGKVIALVFWATWCAPCMAEVPRERDLVARLAGRPFALIGVCGDIDRDRARSVMAEQRMTWPSVWDDGPEGKVAADWGVRSWPTVYLIDAHGTIRLSKVVGPQFDRAVEHLVAEAEAEAQTQSKLKPNTNP